MMAMTDTAPDLQTNHPGVENGTVLDGVKEKIVYDNDAAGNLTGWHKESVA
jgi:hypothetical protein